MADKLFKDYFDERQEDNSIVGNTKILIKRGNNVRKIDVDKFATSAQGDLADNSVQLTGDQTIQGNKTFDNSNVVVRTDGTNYFAVSRNGNLSGAFPYIDMLNDSSSTRLRATGALSFWNRQLNGNLSESVRFTEDGNVGIGTTSPTEKLDVNGNTKITGTLDLNDGSDRTIMGSFAGGGGVLQTAIGNRAGNSNSATHTTSVGYESGRFGTGFGSVNIGYQAGRSNTGNNIVTVGYEAGEGNTRDRQTALGYRAGKGNTGNSQVALGYLAGENNIGDNQTGLGYFAGYANTSTSQTAVGYFAGYTNTGDNQTALGYLSGYLNTGDNQVAIGYEAGRENIGNNNIAIGFESSYQNQGDDVLSIGNQAGKSNTQSNRTIIDNDLLPAFASFSLAEAAFGTGQAGMTYLYFNTITNAIEGVRF